jgi:hypothetical protein
VLVAIGAALVPASARAASTARVLRDAQVSATDGDWTAAVDTEGQIWLGQGRLEVVGRVGTEALGVTVRAGVAAVWTGRREGPSHLGQLLRVTAEGGPVVQPLGRPTLDVRIDPEGTVWATVPGGVLRVDAQGSVQRTVPLDQPVFASEGPLGPRAPQIVDQRPGPRPVAPLALDAQTACPALPPVDRWPFADALRVARLDASRCDRSTALPPKVAAAARWALEQARQEAWAGGDPVRSWALGPPEAPVEDALAAGDWTGHKPKMVITTPSSTGEPVALVLQPLASAGPSAWAGDDGAPACHGKVVLVVRDGDQLAAWSQELRRMRRADTPCREGVSLVREAPLQARPPSEGTTVVYADSQGRLVGERSGRASPALVRDDLVKLSGAGDPLYALASAPALTPGWTRSPGPGGPILIDVDGSIIMGLGQGLLRNTAKGHRPERVPLPAPVQSIRLNERSAYEVVMAGQRAEVLFEAGHMSSARGIITWEPDAPLQVPPSPRPPTPPLAGWMISGASIQPPGSPTPVELGAAVVRVETWVGGAVVLTERGVVGLFPDGGIGWRVPEATDVVVADDIIVAALPWGAAGYRAPLRRPTTVSRPELDDEPEESEPRGPQGGGPQGGGPQGGGPQGGGPQGGGPQGGGPQGGGPQGGGPQGGGPQGGGPQGGGPQGGGPQGGGPQGGGPQGGGPQGGRR